MAPLPLQSGSDTRDSSCDVLAEALALAWLESGGADDPCPTWSILAIVNLIRHWFIPAYRW